MGFFDIFKGGGSNSKESIQKQINAEQARIGKGNWNQKLNDLVKQRDSAGSGGGLKSLGNALKNAGSNIVRDVGMGFNLTDRDADYYRRTAETIARTQGQAAADRYVAQMSKRGGIEAQGVSEAKITDAVNYGKRIGMLNDDGSVNTRYGRGDNDSPAGGSGPVDGEVLPPPRVYNRFPTQYDSMYPDYTPEQVSQARDDARLAFESMNMYGPQRVPLQMQGIGGFRPRFPHPRMPRGGFGFKQGTPKIFERSPEVMPRGGFGSSGQPASQQEMMQKLQGMRGGMRPEVAPRGGAAYFEQGTPKIFGGRPEVMPRLPNPRMPMLPSSQPTSPAFRYAAQNYGRLGGMQRTMPRPMEMMSVAERQRINDMVPNYLPNQSPQPMQSPSKGGGKGSGQTGSQVPGALFGRLAGNKLF